MNLKTTLHEGIVTLTVKNQGYSEWNQFNTEYLDKGWVITRLYGHYTDPDGVSTVKFRVQWTEDLE